MYVRKQNRFVMAVLNYTMNYKLSIVVKKTMLKELTSNYDLLAYLRGGAVLIKIIKISFYHSSSLFHCLNTACLVVQFKELFPLMWCAMLTQKVNKEVLEIL